MGQWRVVIDGTGWHDNGKDTDVEAITQRVVDELVAAGHSIQECHVTIKGGADRFLYPTPKPA